MATRDEILNENVFNAALAAGQQQKPTYAGTFDQQLTDLYDQISTRPQFSYDVNADPLYQQYKDRYIQQGKLAMKDTMGQAAALTGGYGNTYGQQVGQQAYDAYLQNLSAVIPELYGMAYDKYKDEGDDLLKMYGLVGEQRDTEYGRYRDALGDWENERAFQTQRENEEYNRRIAKENEEYNRRMAEEKNLYDRQQNAYASLYALIKASGYRPTDGELAAAGMPRPAADALAAEYQRAVDMENAQFALQQEAQEARYAASSGGGSSGGGSSGGSRSSGGYSGGSRGGSYDMGTGAFSGGYDPYYDDYYSTADIVSGNDNAIAAAAYGYSITNTSGNKATEKQIVDAIEFATNRQAAGKYAYTPNKNARNY